MANTKSAIKRIRRISRQTVVNKSRKSKFKNAIKKMNLFLYYKKKKEALAFLPKLNSELMKIALIAFLARYYNKIPSQNVNHIKHIFIPFLSFLIPVYLVIKQPDLGTALLIAITGLIVIWLTGFRIKYFLYSFFVLICLIPVGIAFLKPYQKSRILTFLNPERDPLGAGYQLSLIHI